MFLQIPTLLDCDKDTNTCIADPDLGCEDVNGHLYCCKHSSPKVHRGFAGVELIYLGGGGGIDPSEEKCSDLVPAIASRFRVGTRSTVNAPLLH